MFNRPRPVSDGGDEVFSSFKSHRKTKVFRDYPIQIIQAINIARATNDEKLALKALNKKLISLGSKHRVPYRTFHRWVERSYVDPNFWAYRRRTYAEKPKISRTYVKKPLTEEQIKLKTQVEAIQDQYSNMTKKQLIRLIELLGETTSRNQLKFQILHRLRTILRNRHAVPGTFNEAVIEFNK